MSNNIYDILKKFNNLDSVKNILNEGKTVKEETGKCNESAKGEKCPVHGMKECAGMYEGAKPDFLDMDKDGDKKEPMKKAAKEKSKGAIAEAVAQVERQLNEKYQGFKKIQESEVEESGLQAYLGKKKYGETGMKALQKAGRDGAGKEKMAMIRAKHDKMDEGDYNEDMLSPGQKKIARMSPPPDKIDANDLKALRAGKDKKKEGNAFSGAMAKAKASGADEFKVGSKEYKVQEGFPTVADAKKRMDDREGKTTHGKKTSTATGTKHERDYDAVDKGADVDSTPKGRGRPKKDRFA